MAEIIVFLIGFLLLAHNEQRHEMRLIPMRGVGILLQPFEFRGIQETIVLAIPVHLLRVEEPVLVLACLVFDENGHGAGCRMA